MRNLNTVLLAYTVALAAVIFTLAAMAVELVNLEQIKDATAQQLRPVSELEPYGGCDEAWRYPKSEGYAWCRDRGLLD